MNTYDNVVKEIQSIEDAYQSNRLSMDEYKELLQDIQRTKVILTAAGDLQVENKLNTLINGLISAAALAL